LKFLGQAKKFFNVLATEPETKAEYFNVRCGSGHRVRGERTEGYQALRCPACGEGVFVLPRSPLPFPAPPKRGESPKPGRTIERLVDEEPVALSDPASVSVDLGGDEHVDAGADIVWDDELPAPDPAPPVARRKAVRTSEESVDLGVAGPPAAAGGAAPAGGTSRSRRQRERPRAHSGGHRDRRNAATDDRLSRAAPEAAVAAGPGRGELVLEIKPASRKRLLHRLLVVLVPVLVIATVAWRYREHVRQGYPLVAEKGRTEGIAALEAGEFDKANQVLSAAKTAVDALGGAVEGADDIRQAADEAAIYVNLISVDLGELLDELGRLGKEARESKFDTLYKGRSIFVDTIVTAAPDGTDSSKYELAFRILPPGEAGNREGRPDREGVFDLTGFKLFEHGLEVGSRVIFGAKLESLEYDEDLKLWKFRLVPKSGVFITHTKALDSLHWRPESIPSAEESGEGRP
jgi:DNA-directed RNA polymerase subunit RPC12/RpoP